MEAPCQALANLEPQDIQTKHVFSCDFNKHARTTIETNFPDHEVFYHDLTERNNKTAPEVDLYIAGFPCQPFSMAGMRQGFKDKRGRGEIFFKVLEYLKQKKPRVFILENVSGLTKINGGKYLEAILAELKSLKLYDVQWKLLDTKKNGVPHSRTRWYCVGIQKKFNTGKFEFPEPIECPSIEHFLEKRDPKLALTGLPKSTNKTAFRNVKAHLRKLQKGGADPHKETFFIDCDSSPYRSINVKGVSPCITCSRGTGHWVTSRGRRLTKEEMMRLQGMNATKFKVAVSQTQLGKQLGNTMSVNVLERLFCRLLPAAKLCKKKALKDRWTTKNGMSKAVKLLAATRSKGFKPLSAEDNKRLASTNKRGASSVGKEPAAKRVRVR